jgi:hypothetical protein
MTWDVQKCFLIICFVVSRVNIFSGQCNFHYSLDIWYFKIKQHWLLQLVIWNINIVQFKLNLQMVFNA